LQSLEVVVYLFVHSILAVSCALREVALTSHNLRISSAFAARLRRWACKISACLTYQEASRASDP